MENATTAKTLFDYTNDKARSAKRALFARYSPSFTVEARDEGVFANRFVAFVILAGLVGATFSLLPTWSWKSWMVDAWLGAMLCFAAAPRPNADPLWSRLLTGSLYGLGRRALAAFGHPFIGVALLGAGLGAQTAGKSSDRNVKADVMIATAVLGAIGLWASTTLRPMFHTMMPGWIAEGARFAVLGMFYALGSFPAHVSIRRDRALASAKKTSRDFPPYIKSYVDAAIERYVEFARTVDAWKRDSVDWQREKERLENGLMDIAHACSELAELERQLAATDAPGMLAHRRNIVNKLETTSDEALKSEMKKALAGIEESLSRLERLGAERERIRFVIFRMLLDMGCRLPERP